MSHYKSNLRDIEFNLFEVLGRDELLGTGPFGDVDAETVKEILREVDRLAREELATSFEEADRNPRRSARTARPRCPSRSRRDTTPGWTPSTGG